MRKKKKKQFKEAMGDLGSSKHPLRFVLNSLSKNAPNQLIQGDGPVEPDVGGATPH